MGSMVKSCCTTRADYSERVDLPPIEPIVSDSDQEERKYILQRKRKVPTILEPGDKTPDSQASVSDNDDICSIALRTPAASQTSDQDMCLLRIQSHQIKEDDGRNTPRFSKKKFEFDCDDLSEKHALSVFTPPTRKEFLKRGPRPRSTKSAVLGTAQRREMKRYSQFRLSQSPTPVPPKSCTNANRKSVYMGVFDAKTHVNFLSSPSVGRTSRRSSKAQLNQLINQHQINYRRSEPYQDMYTDSNMLEEPNIYVLSNCVHKNTQLSRVAKKYIKLADLPTLPRFVEVEIHLLKELPHTTMPSLIQVFESATKYTLILEPIHGNSLLDMVNQKMLNGLLFSQQQIQVIMYQLLSLARHLHRRQYVVRDFKPESIRFSKSDNDIFSLKVLSFFGTTKKKVSLNRIVGSYAYMAPEILKNQSYDQRCDVYSLGVILYILMTLNHPFDNKIYQIPDEGKRFYCKQRVDFNDHKKVIKFADPNFRNYSFELQRLCKRMLEFNPSKRITSSQAYASTFLHTTWDTMQEKRNQKLDLTMNKDVFVMARSFGVNGFRKAVFKYALPILFNNDESRREQYEELYRRIDLNGDGVLSRFELKKGNQRIILALKKIRGMSKQDRSFFVNSLTKKNGFITKQDFILSALVVDFSNDRKIVKEIFDYLDQDGSGNLNQEELCSIFKQDSQEFSSLQLMLLEDMDINNDQEITFEEFYDYLMKRGDQSGSFIARPPSSTGGLPEALGTPMKRRGY